MRNWQKFKTLSFFLLPGIALVCFITLYPILSTIKMSLYRMEYTKFIEYVGLKNFFIFLTNPYTWRSIKVSFVYVLGSVVISLPLGIALAVILNQEIRFKALFRSIIIIPWVLAQLVAALLWKWLLDPVYGPINYLFSQAGFNKISLGDQKWTMLILIFVNVWRSYPFVMVLILAALQTVPKEFYEAAKIDGASKTQSFSRITIPLIMPTLIITLIQITLHSFNMVTLIFLLTGGGPLELTTTLSLKVYMDAFQYWKLPFSAIGGIVVLLFNIIFSLIYIRLLRREPYY